MTADVPAEGLQLRSLVKPEGVLEVSLARVPIAEPGDDEVVVRIDASPINPSDLGLLFAGADMTAAKASGSGADTVITVPLSPAIMAAIAGRVGQSMPVGNEGGGVVVKAGASPQAQALLGRTVGVLGGSMYAQYRVLKHFQCLPLPEGTTAADGASCFVNPLTALGMVETMKLEGHTALLHTAAASNLGQMLNRLCIADGIPLVNVVRRPEQAALLREQGAKYVVDSSSPNFMAELTDAIDETGCTLGFDATGGGRLAGQVLTAMEAAAVRKMPVFSRYGSDVHKQVYIYGGLDRSPTEFVRAFGMSWGLGGWLLTPFLAKIGGAAAQALRERVAREVKTTFASTYTKTVTLPQVLDLNEIAVYGKQATGEKYLITPNG
jgi:NADPH2:quinone reductase